MIFMKGTPRPFLAALILFAFFSLSCGLVDRIRSSETLGNLASRSGNAEATRQRPTPRPTFTSTPAYTPTPTNTATPTITPIPTETPTPVATDTPFPTDTPAPTDTPPPPPTRPPAPPADTPTPAPPPPTPTPDFPFAIAEQGNREFQKTTYNGVTVYAAIVDQNNTPLGGIKIVGDHTPTGMHTESPLSTWNYSTANCLNCGYVKQGNVKFEPGPFIDGTWNIYLADEGGTTLSPVVPLSYSTAPEQWVWDFIIFKKK